MGQLRVLIAVRPAVGFPETGGIVFGIGSKSVFRSAAARAMNYSRGLGIT